MAVLRIRTFGKLSLVVPGSADLHQPVKGCALLAFLCLSDRPIRRSDAASLLWDPAHTPRGLRSLSQVIYELKRLIPGEWLVVRNDTLELAKDSVTSDVADFRVLLRADRLADAIAEYAGPFLEGIPYITDEFDDWRASVGATLEREAFDACKEVSFKALDEADLTTAIAMCARGLELRPYDVDLVGMLIAALASSGQPAAAKRELDARRFAFEQTYGSYPPELGPSLDDKLTAYFESHNSVESRHPQTRLIGRGDELNRIQKQWEATAIHGCASVVLRGEPGIGKSRMLDHVLRKAVIKGARCLSHTPAEVEASLPYSTAAGLLRSLGRQIATAAIHESDRKALATIVPEFFPEQSADATPTRLSLWEAISRAIDSVAASYPTVIAVDNFHWVDESSRELLTFLQKWLAERPVLILMAGRGAYSLRQFEDDSNKPPLIIDLPALRDEHCEELFEEYEQKSGVVIPVATRCSLKARIGGRPLLLLEALHGLGRGPVDSLESAEPRIDAIVAARLRSLTHHAHRLASVAAVLNRDIHLFDLARIAGLSTDEAAHAADELIEFGFIADSTSVRFSHDILRDVAFRALSGPQRVRWHYNIASFFQASGSTRFAEVAHHFEEAGDTESAYMFACLSADEAQRLFAFHDAEVAYQRMLRCAPTQQASYARAQYFRHMVSLGRFKDAEQLVESVEQYFQGIEDSDGQLLCSIVRYSASVRQDPATSLGGALQARNVVKLLAERSPHLLAKVVWQLADPLKSSGDFQLLGSFADDLIDYVDSTKLSQDAAGEILSIAALVSMLSRGYEFALPIADRAVAAAELTTSSSLRAKAAYARGTVALVAGELRTARADYDLILSRYRSDIAEETLARLKTNYCVILIELARYPEANEMGQRALREADYTRRAYVYGNMALACLRQGDADGTIRYANALLRSKSSSPYPWIEPHVHAILGLASLLQNDVNDAIRHWDAAIRDLALAKGLVDCSAIYELGARVAAVCGDSVEAHRVLSEGASVVLPRDYIGGCRLILLKHVLCAKSHDDYGLVKLIEQRAREKGATAIAQEASRILERERSA
jgi:DNA-binding SARP family transcriptional activator/tetratricopeptide (TPR) repeat protein